MVINTEVLLATYVPGCNAAVEKKSSCSYSKPWVFTFVQRGASDNVFSTGLLASCIAAGSNSHYVIMVSCKSVRKNWGGYLIVIVFGLPALYKLRETKFTYTDIGETIAIVKGDRLDAT